MADSPKMNTVGRPSAPDFDVEITSFKSLLGGRGLLQSEKLIFERDDYHRTGVDFADIEIDPFNQNGQYPSDHLPVTAELVLPPAP